MVGRFSGSADAGISAEFMDEVTRRIEEREAQNPSPPPPPEVPWPDKPPELAAAEKELSTWDIVRTLQEMTCRSGPPCTRASCRRLKRCRELDEIDAEIAKARSHLEALQAKWPAPDPATAVPAPVKRKGRRKARRSSD